MRCLCQKEADAESCHYADVVVIRNTDRPDNPPTRRGPAQQPGPAAVYAEIVHRPIYANQQNSRNGSAM